MREAITTPFDEDTGLMAKAQEGDQQAYARLYEKYVPTVRRYIAVRSEHAESNEDLVQEVFTRVWEHRGRYRAGMAVLPYLLGFARNVRREQQACAHRDTRVESREPDACREDAGPEAAARRKDQAEWVRSRVAELPPKQRQALELVYLAQLPVAEAAQVMNCSTKALRRNLREARQRLETAFFFAGEGLEPF